MATVEYNEANLARWTTWVPGNRRPRTAYGAYISPEARRDRRGYLGSISRATGGGWEVFPDGRMTSTGERFNSRRAAFAGLVAAAVATKGRRAKFERDLAKEEGR